MQTLARHILDWRWHSFSFSLIGTLYVSVVRRTLKSEKQSRRGRETYVVVSKCETEAQARSMQIVDKHVWEYSIFWIIPRGRGR